MFEFEFIGTLAAFQAFKKRVLENHPDCGFDLVGAKDNSMFFRITADQVTAFQIGFIYGEMSKKVEA